MSVRWYRTFTAVAREGSFSAAAEKIGLTQAAVSIQMSNLERHLGVALFDRSTRTVVLNATGHRLVPRAQEVVDLYESVGKDLQEGDLGGTLTLGAIPPTFTRLLPDTLQRIHEAHPRIAFQVSTGVSQDLMRKVEQGELDAALVGQPPFKLAGSLSWQPVMSEPLVLMVPQGTSFRSLADAVQRLPYVGVSRASWTGRLVHETLRKHGLRVKHTMDLDSLETIAAMVARGFGISIFPLAPSRWPTDPLVQVSQLTPKVERRIGLVFRAGMARSSLVHALLETMRELPADRVGRRRQATLHW